MIIKIFIIWMAIEYTTGVFLKAYKTWQTHYSFGMKVWAIIIRIIIMMLIRSLYIPIFYWAYMWVS